VFVLLALTALLSGCGPRSTPSTQPQTAEQRNAAIVAIAQQFGATEDIEAAQVALAPLDLPNPGQAVLALAESYIAQGQDTRTAVALVALAKALGPASRMAEEFLAREGANSGVPAAVALAPTATPLPTPTDTPLPPTETPLPEPTAAPTATPVLEPTATPTETPLSQPQASTTSPINVRSGPGTVYPVVSQLQPGRPVDILGRNADRTWWQVLLSNGSEGWVAASVVDVTGLVDGVAVAANIPAAPAQAPQPTAVPQPTSEPAAQPTQPPAPQQPSGGYALTQFRLRPIGENAQRCDGGGNNIFVLVVDAAGNPIDGVRVSYTGDEAYPVRVTGDQGKGPGRVEWDIYRGGGGMVQIVDANNSPLSPQAPAMSADWPAFDLMYAAGYCNCKPHPDAASCRADLESKNYFFAVGHYVYEVTFQRQ
jgi:hypothetical protein